MHDCLIIGGGPAGLSAAIYLIRKKVDCLVLTQTVGGQIMDGPLIENYPGFEQIPGPEWVEKVQAQAEKLGIKPVVDQTVSKISGVAGNFVVETESGEKFEGKTVLICSGKSPRKLGVPGEEEFLGKGISQCVTCDGPLFRDKSVAVVGGGNSAIAAALELEKYAQKVYVINLGEKMIGEEVRLDQLAASDKVEIINQAKTSAIIGTTTVEKLKYEDLQNKAEKEIDVSGIFVEIGWVPSTAYLEGLLEMTEDKEVKIDQKNATNVAGIFAAGDVTEIPFKQLVIAAGEGAKASLSVWDFLMGKDQA